MAIKNYTSGVPAKKSIEHIETALASHGAKQILKKYTPDGKVLALCFIMEIEGQNMPFKVPALVDECEKILRSYMKKPRRDRLKGLREQAERTTWKIVADWLDGELAMLELGQREVMEIFMPCLYNPVSERTYFQIIKERGFKALMPGISAKENKSERHEDQSRQ